MPIGSRWHSSCRRARRGHIRGGIAGWIRLGTRRMTSVKDRTYRLCGTPPTWCNPARWRSWWPVRPATLTQARCRAFGDDGFAAAAGDGRHEEGEVEGRTHHHAHERERPHADLAPPGGALVRGL